MHIYHLTAFVVRNLGMGSLLQDLSQNCRQVTTGASASSGAQVGSELCASLLMWLPVGKIQLLERCLSQALALHSC